MKKEILELIKLINDKHVHLNELRTLITMLILLNANAYKNQYNTLIIIAKTTLNAHYDYQLYTDPMYQDPKYHIDNYIDKKQLKKGYLTAIVPEDINFTITTND